MARGHEIITASVPAFAPPTPPLTGQSTKVRPRPFSSAPIAAATRGPVVERSTTVVTAVPWATLATTF